MVEFSGILFSISSILGSNASHLNARISCQSPRGFINPVRCPEAETCQSRVRLQTQALRSLAHTFAYLFVERPII